ncbi:hypothetical protein CROQUDRAFT_102110 [Cronartium quercuum f. sp. fusiforme G11]|uniref:Uncharacterized protein n=1 Tax=Cronartium quercuum f. sp. fusiforme G11 TaxID=708437 RepID=A0A9P6N806_9BASI|nr:hypothetical protein CROQUDRAFT_102110 [Cronartium quercuum f. sp. fusiforme G11]
MAKHDEARKRYKQKTANYVTPTIRGMKVVKPSNSNTSTMTFSASFEVEDIPPPTLILYPQSSSSSTSDTVNSEDLSSHKSESSTSISSFQSLQSQVEGMSQNNVLSNIVTIAYHHSYSIQQEDILEASVSASVVDQTQGMDVIGSEEAISGDYNNFSAHGSEFIDFDELALSVQSGGGIWALNDTGASHHMFNDINLFQASTIKKIEGTNK